MFQYIWPVVVIVLANVFYQIASKSTPKDMNPMAILTVTYAVSTLIAFIMYFVTSKGGNLIAEYKKLNFAPFVLGIAVVTLETGFIFAYRAGWMVSRLNIVNAAILTVVLIFVGYLVFHESITLNKVLGIVICLAGIAVINYK